MTVFPAGIQNLLWYSVTRKKTKTFQPNSPYRLIVNYHLTTTIASYIIHLSTNPIFTQDFSIFAKFSVSMKMNYIDYTT